MHTRVCYILWKDSLQVTFISWHIYFALMIPRKFSLSKFLFCNTVLSTAVTRFLEVIHFISESLHTFTSLCLFPVPSLATTILLLTFLRFHIKNDTIQYLSFFVWIIPLSIVPSRFNYVVTNDRIPFFVKVIQYSIICIYSLYIHKLTTSCFHVLAIAGINIA